MELKRKLRAKAPLQLAVRRQYLTFNGMVSFPVLFSYNHIPGSFFFGDHSIESQQFDARLTKFQHIKVNLFNSVPFQPSDAFHSSSFKQNSSLWDPNLLQNRLERRPLIDWRSAIKDHSLRLLKRSWRRFSLHGHRSKRLIGSRQTSVPLHIGYLCGGVES